MLSRPPGLLDGEPTKQGLLIRVDIHAVQHQIIKPSRAYMVRIDSPSDHVRSIMSKLAAKKLVTMDSNMWVEVL